MDLQASNDITVNTAINVAGSTGGALTLQAGRNINLNANINTANGNFTAIAGDSGALVADLLVGTPTVTLGAGVRINAGTGSVVLVADEGNFVNNSGSANPITAAAARIYSTNAANDSLGGMSTAQSQFGCTFTSGCTGGAIASTGLSFLFSIVPPVDIPPVVVENDPSRHVVTQIEAEFSVFQYFDEKDVGAGDGKTDLSDNSAGLGISKADSNGGFVSGSGAGPDNAHIMLDRTGTVQIKQGGIRLPDNILGLN